MRLRLRLAVSCALLLPASGQGLAQDAFEPNPSRARLTADEAYGRMSAKSLQAAGIDAPTAIRLDDAGRVLVVGGMGGTPRGPRIVRLDADGRLDPTFGTAGVAEVLFRAERR